MAKIVNISNGVGTAELINDTYAVTASVTGYDNTCSKDVIIPSKINNNTIDIIIILFFIFMKSLPSYFKLNYFIIYIS